MKIFDNIVDLETLCLYEYCCLFKAAEYNGIDKIGVCTIFRCDSISRNGSVLQSVIGDE